MSLRSAVKKLIPHSLYVKIEPYGHLVEAVVQNTINGFPAKDLKVIGVTGTNGKTSTCFLIHQMLHDAGYKVGLMTTVAYGTGDNLLPQLHMTNVPVSEFMARIKRLKQEGVEWLVLETTSHGLAQNRLWGVPFSLAVMTNVTHEHLDYHGSFEKYLAAKKKLFEITNRNQKGLRTGVINADDPSANEFKTAIAKPITYGVKKGDFKATNIKSTTKGSTYTVKTKAVEYKINCNLAGSFNISNSLAAVTVGQALGLSKQQIEKGIAALKRVEGRMEPVDEGQDFSIIVDFAHTPDSFEKVFKDVKPMVKGKLIVLFGSPGHRDEAKRGIQGELAGRYCDEVIITEDDERDVDGLEIMNQIAEGAETAGKEREKDLFLVHDRTRAINFAIKRAKAGDTVLLLGKGHEKIIYRADGEHPWDEIATAKTAVENRLANQNTLA